jgi:hypothetical protein
LALHHARRFAFLTSGHKGWGTVRAGACYTPDAAPEANSRRTQSHWNRRVDANVPDVGVLKDRRQSVDVEYKRICQEAFLFTRSLGYVAVEIQQHPLNDYKASAAVFLANYLSGRDNFGSPVNVT